MDVGIITAREILVIEDLEPDMRVLCEKLVFNKTPEATEGMHKHTTYERTCVEAKKKKLIPTKKHRGEIVLICFKSNLIVIISHQNLRLNHHFIIHMQYKPCDLPLRVLKDYSQENN